MVKKDEDENLRHTVPIEIKVTAVYNEYPGCLVVCSVLIFVFLCVVYPFYVESQEQWLLIFLVVAVLAESVMVPVSLYFLDKFKKDSSFLNEAEQLPLPQVVEPNKEELAPASGKFFVLVQLLQQIIRNNFSRK